MGHIVWFLITSVCVTLRKRIVKQNGVEEILGKKQCIVALWHNRTFVPCYVYRYCVKHDVPMSMLTSASKDGALLSTVAEDYRMRTVRGSSNRRGVAGFREMLRELNPQYRNDIVPGNIKPYHLRLTIHLTYAYLNSQDSISNYRQEYFARQKTI